MSVRKGQWPVIRSPVLECLRSRGQVGEPAAVQAVKDAITLCQNVSDHADLRTTIDTKLAILSTSRFLG